ncbi:MAG: DNA-directed RNA polymerase subunit beta [Actinobacteria bacterium]|nr:DNA-directed RNA polymerase subunit beta [Actinomycetota bacterium]
MVAASEVAIRHCLSEGLFVAAARKKSDTTPARVSFAKIREPLEVPDLLALQRESFDWLLGNEAWQKRLAAAIESGAKNIPRSSGLNDVFDEISPIEDYSGTMSLTFTNPRLDLPRYTEAECRAQGRTYSAQLYVTAEFMNHETGEIKSQTVYMGDFQLMTKKGTFIINGTERVVVSQLVRSPGVYFEKDTDRTTDKDIFTSKIIPSRGAWLEFEIDKKDFVAVRIDRKRKQPVSVLLRALGMTTEQMRSHFQNYESFLTSMEKDTTKSQDEAMLDIYRKLRPGEPPTLEAARNLLDNFYFNRKRYDLAKVGRHKVNSKLGLVSDLTKSTLDLEDILTTITYLVRLHNNETEFDSLVKEVGKVRVVIDDIDHFGNRRLRTVGELIQNQLRVGLSRMERVVKERMTTQEVEAITPQTLINIKPVMAMMKEFFGTSQLSQFMDQTNPLSGLTHKRRLSALGPGGLSRERAGFEVRDVHPSHYGRMCPIETPEGPNIGLIGSLSSYARVNEFGFVETPYCKVVKGRVTDKIDYLTAGEEDLHVIAQANSPLKADGHFAEDRVLVRRRGGDVDYITPADVDYMDVSPRQMVSVATAMIPFLEHDDANRALMGSNMQRQAVPLVTPESPYVGTGMEHRAAKDAGDVVVATNGGVVSNVSSYMITVTSDESGTDEYPMEKFRRTNQGTCFNQKPLVKIGDRVEAGQIIADGPSTQGGELALGRNLLVAFMPWQGHNFEDAIILNQRLVQDDVLTSIHIERYEIQARNTKLGPEEITRDIPNVSDEILADLDERGIIRIGADVVPGDILVGKVTPKGETELTPEERLLRAIFGEKGRDVRDTSLKVPHGESGKVINVDYFAVDNGDELGADVNYEVHVYIAQKRKITVGDKLAGRHGNKGVISIILPPEDMPFLEDGTPVDIVLNPLGVPGRMNIGQVLETHLGWIAHSGWEVQGDPEWAQHLASKSVAAGTKLATPVFDGAREEEISGLLASTRPLSADAESNPVGPTGKAILFDGRTGEQFPEPVAVGYKYVLKLLHLVDDKIHARSTGPYSMITQQPLGGKAQFGGQRFGEMEVWALQAYGAAYALQELLTIKSDDVLGRVKVYEAIVKGQNIPEPGIPESFKVLLKEMRALGLNVVPQRDGVPVEMHEAVEDGLRTAEELGIDLSRREPSSVDEI